MPYEQLIESVQVSAEERIKDLKEKASQDAAEIIKEAAGKDGSIKRRHLERIKRIVDMERHKLLAKVHEERRMQLTRAKDEVFKRAFSEAKQILFSARKQPNYEIFFKKMLKEALSELEGGNIQLHIDKKDADLCRKLLAELNMNCDIITDITTAGGLNANTSDGKFVVFNTIESRFERAKILLKLDIFTVLYGGQGGV
ncbi:MAG: V-type ATP synthase subunit E [Methanoregula sp. PtaU1.Bin051]|nr:MAG: V-type ATP synthase subunit E [Methanoregula sp. PtaU1.Bin051]